MEEDGMSVYDVTDPSHIRYAFVYYDDGHDASIDYHVLSAFEYWKIYDTRLEALQSRQVNGSYDAIHVFPQDLETALRNVPLISAVDTQNAWRMQKFTDTLSGP